jgi:hypothetical protein
MQTDLKDKTEQKEKETDISVLVLYNDDVNSFEHVIACLV